MNYEHENLIRELHNRIELLKSKYQALQKSNARVVAKNSELFNQVEEQKKKISILEQQYSSVKLAQSVSLPVEDKDEAKSQILRIVREIDECIALLNR